MFLQLKASRGPWAQELEVYFHPGTMCFYAAASPPSVPLLPHKEKLSFWSFQFSCQWRILSCICWDCSCPWLYIMAQKALFKYVYVVEWRWPKLMNMAYVCFVWVKGTTSPHVKACKHFSPKVQGDRVSNLKQHRGRKPSKFPSLHPSWPWRNWPLVHPWNWCFGLHFLDSCHNGSHSGHVHLWLIAPLPSTQFRGWRPSQMIRTSL